MNTTKMKPWDHFNRLNGILMFYPTTGVDKIIFACPDEFGSTPDEMRSKTQAQPHCEARMFAMFILEERKKLLRLSLKSIGALFGGRDHSTVINAKRTIAGYLKHEPFAKDRLQRIKLIAQAY